MRKYFSRRFLIIAAIPVAAFTIWRLFLAGDGAANYEYAFVTSGVVEKTVTASGTLRPRRLIEIGAEVSGKILSLDAEFNDSVVEGQRLALIDPSEIEAQIVDLEARLQRAKGTRLQAEAEQISAAAGLKEGERELVRALSLQSKGVISEQALDPIETRVTSTKADVLRAESSLRIADADIASAEAALDRARVDLARTIVRSPVNGIVLNRVVEVGQTLTSGFQTPPSL